MTTVSGRAPAATLPVTIGQIKVLLSAHQAVHEVYGGTGMEWDHRAGVLTLQAKPDAEGRTYGVTVAVRAAGATRTTVDVTATITTPETLDTAGRAALRTLAQREALQESRDMVSILMKQVAKGVGRGFAGPATGGGQGLAS